MKRIKAHCLECAGTIQAVKGCSGKLTPGKGNDGTCWLHPYRMGKNPARRESGVAPPPEFRYSRRESVKSGVEIDSKKKTDPLPTENPQTRIQTDFKKTEIPKTPQKHTETRVKSTEILQVAENIKGEE